MRIAVSVEDDRIHPNFAETHWFRLFEVERQRIVRDLTVPSLGEGPEALVAALGEYRVNALVCGGIDGKTRAALGETGVLVFGGIIGRPEDAVNALLNGTLTASKQECSESCEACTGNCKSCQIK